MRRDKRESVYRVPSRFCLRDCDSRPHTPCQSQNRGFKAARAAQGQAFATLVSPSWGYQRTGVGRSRVIVVSGFPSKSTISRVRYGFSLWQHGQRRLKTWDFRWDASVSSFATRKLPTMAGTGIGALQCRHTTPRKIVGSVSSVIVIPHWGAIRVFGVTQSYSKGFGRVQWHGKRSCGNWWKVAPINGLSG